MDISLALIYVLMEIRKYAPEVLHRLEAHVDSGIRRVLTSSWHFAWALGQLASAGRQTGTFPVERVWPGRGQAGVGNITRGGDGNEASGGTLWVRYACGAFVMRPPFYAAFREVGKDVLTGLSRLIPAAWRALSATRWRSLKERRPKRNRRTAIWYLCDCSGHWSRSLRKKI